MTEAEAEKDDGAGYGNQKGTPPETIREVPGNGNARPTQDNCYQLQNEEFPVVNAKRTEFDLSDGVRQNPGRHQTEETIGGDRDESSSHKLAAILPQNLDQRRF